MVRAFRIFDCSLGLIPSARSHDSILQRRWAFEHVPQILERSCGKATGGFPCIACVKKRLYSVILKCTCSTLPSRTRTSSEADPSTFVRRSSVRSKLCILLCLLCLKFAKNLAKNFEEIVGIHGAAGNLRINRHHISNLQYFWKSGETSD